MGEMDKSKQLLSQIFVLKLTARATTGWHYWIVLLEMNYDDQELQRSLYKNDHK